MTYSGDISTPADKSVHLTLIEYPQLLPSFLPLEVPLLLTHKEKLDHNHCVTYSRYSTMHEIILNLTLPRWATQKKKWHLARQ